MTNVEIREVFARNLVRLCETYPTVTKAAEELGINRVQLNRYRAGESFPRPDVLQKICDHFGVDANILVAPLEELPARAARFLLNEVSVQGVLADGPDGASALRRIASGEVDPQEGVA